MGKLQSLLSALEQADFCSSCTVHYKIRPCQEVFLGDNTQFLHCSNVYKSPG